MAHDNVIKILHDGGYSCVIENRGRIYTFTERGVKDLYNLYKNSPEILQGAFIADKVVGKGAAALMALGAVSEVYCDIISENAVKLLQDCRIMYSFAKQVSYIINRNKNGMCPVETLCMNAGSPEECLPLIENLINKN